MSRPAPAAPPVTGLAEARSRAHRFVAERGGPLERVVLATLVREAPAPALFEALAARQEVSGALGDDGGPAGLASTLRALAWLDALGLMDHPQVERAVDFVVSCQDEAGDFAETADADEEARIATTGAAGGLLAKTPFARPSVLRGAEAWLVSRWGVERVQGPRYGPILAYTHLLTQMDSERGDEILQWCGRELERGFRTRAFGALPVARVLLRARARALPGARLDGQELVAALVDEQAPDGSFPARDGLGPVRATLEGLEALARLGAEPHRRA